MAQANISVTERQFRCPICLDVLRDPASIPCGHTYCMSCISQYWDQEESAPCCPQCREQFSPRPALRRNTVLAEVVDKLRLSETESEPEPFLGGAGEVPCDFCPSEARLRAVKSCLVCLASFCAPHGLPHRDVGTLRRHRLVEAVESLSRRLCPRHRLGLEPRNAEEPHDLPEPGGDCPVCPVCEGDPEEASPESSRARRQVQLQESQRSVQTRIQTMERDLDEFQQDLESLKVSASAVLDDTDAVFADLAQRLDKTRAEVRTRLEAKQRSVLSRAEKDLELMEKNLEELRKRDEEITQLLQTDDSGHFLQAAPLLLLPLASSGRPRAVCADVFSAAGRSLNRLRSRVDELCRDEVDALHRTGDKGLSAVNCKPRQTLTASVESRAAPVSFPLSSLSLAPADHRMRAAFLRYWCSLTLDVDTAHPTLVLLDGLQGAHCGEEPQPYAPHPLRFDSVAQVLCREGQLGGASYWEVEWRGGGWADVGVTYRGIGRKGGGKPCLLGRNENSWRLRCTRAGYAAWHDNRKTTVAAPASPRIGVFLERQRGALSFYGVSDCLLLLHTFRGPFTQPLYPAFRLDLDSTLRICPPDTQ